MKPDFRESLDAFVTGMESEHKADHKKFYRENDGQGRARSAIAALESAITRLNKIA